MAAEAVCDVCGKREPMLFSESDWRRPPQWHQFHGQLLCSLECFHARMRQHETDYGEGRAKRQPKGKER